MFLLIYLHLVWPFTFYFLHVSWNKYLCPRWQIKLGRMILQCPHSNSRHLWIHFITWQKVFCRCNYGPENREIILDYPGWHDLITQALESEGIAEGRSKRPEVWETRPIIHRAPPPAPESMSRNVAASGGKHWPQATSKELHLWGTKFSQQPQWALILLQSLAWWDF